MKTEELLLLTSLVGEHTSLYTSSPSMAKGGKRYRRLRVPRSRHALNVLSMCWRATC